MPNNNDKKQNQTQEQKRQSQKGQGAERENQGDFGREQSGNQGQQGGMPKEDDTRQVGNAGKVGIDNDPDRDIDVSGRDEGNMEQGQQEQQKVDRGHLGRDRK